MNRDGAVINALERPNNVARVWFRLVAICGLTLFLTLLRGFFSSFPLVTKTNISNFQFNQDRGSTWPAKADATPSVNIIYIFLIDRLIDRSIERSIEIESTISLTDSTSDSSVFLISVVFVFFLSFFVNMETRFTQDLNAITPLTSELQ